MRRRRYGGYGGSPDPSSGARASERLLVTPVTTVRGSPPAAQPYAADRSASAGNSAPAQTKSQRPDQERRVTATSSNVMQWRRTA